MWQCVKCQERMQQNFDICWKCGTSRDDTENTSILLDDASQLEAATDSVEEELLAAHTPLLKQAYDLKADDFVRHPVWVQCHIIDYDEPWYEETDEATFRPWTAATPVDPRDAMFLIRASMKLANGTELTGYLTPQAEGEPLEVGIMQPVAFLSSGEQLGFWDGAYKRSEEDRLSFYSALNLESKDVFPLSFSCETDLANGRVSGTLPGFGFLKDFTVVQFYN